MFRVDYWMGIKSYRVKRGEGEKKRGEKGDERKGRGSRIVRRELFFTFYRLYRFG